VTSVGPNGTTAKSRRYVSQRCRRAQRLYQFTAYDACNQTSAIRFVDEVIRRLPFRVLVIQTDNGAEFQSRFHCHLDARDIRHVYIRPKTPHLNGKIERSHRVDEQEFYQLLDKDGIADDIHLFKYKLREWEDYYKAAQWIVARTRHGAVYHSGAVRKGPC
jgi:transposase InsO family protein